MSTDGLGTRRDLARAGVAAVMAGMAVPRSSRAFGGAGYQLGCYTRPWDKTPKTHMM